MDGHCVMELEAQGEHPGTRVFKVVDLFGEAAKS